jgi:hypothetical protein
MKYIISTVVALIVSFTLSAQIGLKVIKEREFKGEALYGYMNGGSELFFEYGFESLISKEVIYNGEKYTVDIFDMDSPINAFGVYSVHIFKPKKVDYLLTNINGYDCLTTYQIQAAIKDLYISITFNSGETAAKGGEELLLKYIDEQFDSITTNEITENSIPNLTIIDNPQFGIESKNHMDPRDIKDFFPEKLANYPQPYSGNVKYVNGPISLTNIYQGSIDQFKGATHIWFYRNTEGEISFLIGG